jgi:excisionase family DNA binding protein
MAQQLIITITTPEELREMVTEVIKGNQPKAKETPSQATYLSREEAAKLLGISLPTLWKWTKKGVIPARRMEGRVYYIPTEIESAMSQMAVNGKKGARRSCN